MLELHNRVIRPQLLADFLAGYHFAGVLQQFSEDQERLLAQADLFGFVLAQFTGAKVEFKACETTSPLEVLTATVHLAVLKSVPPGASYGVLLNRIRRGSWPLTGKLLHSCTALARAYPH